MTYNKFDMVKAENKLTGEVLEGEVVEIRKDMLIVMDESDIYKLPYKLNKFTKLGECCIL